MKAILVCGFNGRFYAVSEEGKLLGKSFTPFPVILSLKALGIEDFHCVPFKRIATDPLFAEVKEVERDYA